MTRLFLLAWAAAVLVAVMSVKWVLPAVKASWFPPAPQESMTCTSATYRPSRKLPEGWRLRLGDLTVAEASDAEAKSCAKAYEGLYVRRALEQGAGLTLYELRPAPQIRRKPFVVLPLDSFVGNALNAGGTVALFSGLSSCYDVAVLAVWKTGTDRFEGAFAPPAKPTCNILKDPSRVRIVPQLLEAEN